MQFLQNGEFTKKNLGPNRTGDQYLLNFGNRYSLSIITDGMGSENGLYEIGVVDLTAGKMVSLPGITNTNESVRGYLSASEVDAIVLKMISITGFSPVSAGD